MTTNKDWSELNVRIGSCPHCGKPVFESDYLRVIDPSRPELRWYECIQCRQRIERKEIVPF